MADWRNVNNWHWVEKNCFNWAQSYFKKVVGAAGDANGCHVEIEQLEDCTGDVDLNQRKGRLLTIYDVQLKYAWKGTLEDGTEAEGMITVPEFAHDVESDELVFDISIKEETKAKEPIKNVIKTALIPEIRKRLQNFKADMIEENRSDVYFKSAKPAEPAVKEQSKAHNKDSNESSSLGQEDNSKASTVNTTTLTDTIEFQTSAHELFETLLDPQRVQIWTRGPAKIGREPGTAYELFNGNVSGDIKQIVPDKEIVMTWRLKAWPPNHFSTVTFDFDQGSDYLNLKVTQVGVPIGEEEVTRQNWNGYYWRAIKQAFGFGAVF